MPGVSFGNDPVSTSTILECVDAVEYTELSDAQKDALKIVLSCGTVNMGSGSIIRSWVLDVIFPSGTSHNAIASKFTIS
jgi:hypothetical protein